MNFLSHLAETIIKPHVIDYKDIAIILPNKRAQRALEIALSKKAKRAIFPPTIFSIDEFMGHLSGLQVLPTSELLIYLYHSYQKTAQQHNIPTDEFQNFMSWGINLISDFNDIDRQLADANVIFSYLKDFKEIGIEIDSSGEPTPGQQRYLQFFGMLSDLYHTFGNELRKTGKAYPGLVYRTAAENISLQPNNQLFTKYYFAGLNAMTPSESEVIYHFFALGKVEFVFDFDEFYLEYTEQIREMLRTKFHLEKKDIHLIGNHFANEEKSIRTYGASKTMNQIYEAIAILHTIEAENPAALDRTAVVLADENLLIPFVHAYDSKKCNISKKYPVRATSTYQLLRLLLTMAQNFQRFQGKTHINSDMGIYYHQDVLALYRHPLVAAAFFSNSTDHQLFTTSLVRINQIFFAQKTLNERCPASCPDVTVTGGALIDALSGYFSLIYQKLTESPSTETSSNGWHSSPTELELLPLFLQAFAKTKEILSRFSNHDNLDVRTVSFFLNEQIDALDLSFRGDFGHGVQVLGLLETRTLDFDHVIMLSANEGTIPSGNKDNSLILFEIKKQFHLSTYEQNDAIYAYHFFHILQRAKDIHLIYNADSSDAVAEPSRFIQQIAFKIKKWNLQNIHFETIIRPPLPLGTNSNGTNIAIEKTEEMLLQLRALTYSASSLNAFINCPLQFYFRYVARIIPEKEINENIDQNIIGLVIHQALEEIGRDILAQPGADVVQLMNAWANKIQQNYIAELFCQHEEVQGQDITRGRLFLATEVVRKTLATYIPEWKKQLLAGTQNLLGCELRFTHTLNIDEIPITFTGTADRIDLRGDTVTILDYKSGKAYKTSCDNIDELFCNPDNKHIFQLLFYTFLYRNRNKLTFPADKFPETKNISSGVIYFRELAQGKEFESFAELPANDQNSFDTDFENGIKELIINILEKGKFQQTTDIKHCKYCDYVEICQRKLQNDW